MTINVLIKQLFIVPVLLFAILLSNSSFAANISDVELDKKLAKIEQIKSSDLELSQKLMLELSEYEEHFAMSHIHKYTYLQAYLFARAGNFEKALEYHKLNFTSLNNNVLLQAQANYVFLKVLMHQYQDASELVNSIKSLVNRALIDENLKFDAYNTLAFYYNQIDQFERSLALILPLFDKEGLSKRYQCFIGSQLVRAYLGSDDNEVQQKGLTKAKETHNICEDINETIIADLITYLQAQYLVKQNNKEQTKQAIALLERHYKDVLKQQFQLNQIRFETLLLQAYKSIKDIDNSNKYLERLLANEQAIKHPDLMLLAYELAYQRAQLNNDLPSQLTYLDLLIKAQQFNANINKQKSLVLSSIEYPIEQIVKDLIQARENIAKYKETQQELLVDAKKFEPFFIGEFIYQIVLLILIIAASWYTFKLWRSKKAEVLALRYTKFDGFLNRSAFIKQCQSLLYTAEHQKTVYSLVILNVDNFRRVNEIQGKDRSNRLLKLVIKEHQKYFPNIALKGLLGGDEFIFLLADCNAKHSINLAEKFRSELNFLDTRSIAYQFDVSASFGATDSNLGSNDIAIMLQQAEAAIAETKRQYKNCCVCFDSELSLEPDY